MNIFKKIIGTAFVLAVAVCAFAGCTETKTQEPNNSVTPTETPVPTATPTPKPNSADLYTWEYEVLEDGSASIAIVVKDGADPRDITEVVIPSEIDGHPVTRLPWDLFGQRSAFSKDGKQGRKGLCHLINNDPTKWTEPQCFIEKLTIPASVTYVEEDILWFNATSIKEIVFENIDNIETYEKNGLRCPGLNKLAEEAGGFLMNGDNIILALPAEEIVFPANAKTHSGACFDGMGLDYSAVKTIRINEGFETISSAFLEGNFTEGLELYIPASVSHANTSAKYDWVWLMFEKFKMHLVKNSPFDYFVQYCYWDYIDDIVIYDMGDAFTAEDKKFTVALNSEDCRQVIITGLNMPKTTTSIVIPEKIGSFTVNAVGADLLANLRDESGNCLVEDVTLPKTVTAITAHTFDNTPFMDKLLNDGNGFAIIDGLLIAIDERAISADGGLVIPEGVVGINKEIAGPKDANGNPTNTFGGSVTYVDMRASTLKKIEGNAFNYAGMANVTKVYVGSSVEMITNNNLLLRINKIKNGVQTIYFVVDEGSYAESYGIARTYPNIVHSDADIPPQ